MNHRFHVGLAALATCLAGQPAMAQQSSPAQLSSDLSGDIIVTARRQSERLQDVPISIIAIDGDTLNERNVKTLNDLPAVAAGLSVQNTASNRNDTTFSIRGQGQTFGQNSPGVVTYFADVPDFGKQFFDLENVQVLKGPQGTLFGRNTTGGAVLFVPRKPGNEFSGYVIGRLGSYDRHDLEFAMGGALIPDQLMVRLSGQILRRDGFTKNLFDNSRTDNERKTSFRASVVIQPFEWLENYFIYQYTHINEAGSGAAIAGFTPASLNPNIAPLEGQLTTYLAEQLARGPRTINVNFPLGNGLKSKGFVNTTTAKINDNISVKNIFSRRLFKQKTDYDIDGTPLPILDVSNPYQSDFNIERTEEVQLHGEFGMLTGTIGYYDEYFKSRPSVGFDTVQYVLVPFGGPIRAFAIGNSKNTSKAGYAQFDLRPTDGLTLTAGIRRTKDFRSSTSATTLVPFPGVEIPLGGATVSGTFKATTWNLNALYEINQDINVYASVRKGYKSGGFNSTALNPADRFFAPETVTDYEIGLKSQWQLGGWQIRANVDLFYDDYKNIQRFVNLNTTPASTVTRNAAAGKIKGVDVDLVVKPAKWFDVAVKYTYLDAKYDSYTDPSLGDLSNSRFPNSPKHQLNVTPRITLPIPESLGNVTATANIYYQSLIAFDPVNRFNGNPIAALSVPGSTAPSYTKIDLRLDWRRIAGSGFSAAVFARNVTDKDYIVGGNNQLPTQFGTVAYLYGEPRMFGVEGRFEF
ncbi:TonB-dependent receptor [Sphingobium sp. CFD-1]|uniref:TonB-dependent receptor n=1 Tax=Sphingobium sp. CFD-1 TaxID=2878545 RepID=UPI00214C8386|nr:TonB-dependent receptor [Sphingobium sp. CFD-1]